MIMLERKKDFPKRTCVVCKNKSHKDTLYRFVLLGDEIVLDLNHRINSYGYYLCKEHTDYEIDLKKFLKRKNLKRLNARY